MKNPQSASNYIVENDTQSSSHICVEEGNTDAECGWNFDEDFPDFEGGENKPPENPHSEPPQKIDKVSNISSIKICGSEIL